MPRARKPMRPDVTTASNKPGTERFRDEQRDEGGPRMHGLPWHEHDEPPMIEPEAMAAPEAVPEVEGGGAREGMSKGVPRKTKGRRRQAQRSPRGKGIKRRKPSGRSKRGTKKRR